MDVDPANVETFLPMSIVKPLEVPNKFAAQRADFLNILDLKLSHKIVDPTFEVS